MTQRAGVGLQAAGARLQGSLGRVGLGLLDMPIGDSATGAGDVFGGWRLWAGALVSDVSNDLPAIAFDARAATLLVGADTTIDEDLVVGAAVSYESSDVDTFFNAGSQDIDTYSLMGLSVWRELQRRCSRRRRFQGRTNVDADILSAFVSVDF